ncbi:MAG: hypothetical protein ACLFM0_05405 [Spirochaetales bacterium]
MHLPLASILKNAADYAIALQHHDGSFPAGHNGPYYDPETPVRNTAHYLYLFADLYEKHHQENYRAAAERAVDYLLSRQARPFGYTFHCRNSEAKDRSNGLVGQAWVIEALVKASEVLRRQDCYDLAEEVFLLHPWDRSVSLWNKVDVDGAALSYDRTFNHQLWFAAAASLLDKSSAAGERAEAFVRNIVPTVQRYPDGTIYHISRMGSVVHYLANGPKAFAREVKSRYVGLKNRGQLYSKSVGYHGFNMYALALLKRAFPDDRVWGSSMVSEAVAATRNEKFRSVLAESEFGYWYNVSGIEIAFALQVLEHADANESCMWLQRQFDMTYASDRDVLSAHARDADTARARIYQACRVAETLEADCD